MPRAGITFTVNATVFKPLDGSDDTGPFALTDIAESGIFDNTRYHVKGVNGSYFNHGNLIGYKLRMKGRFVGSNPYADAVALSQVWEDTAISIVDQNGVTYNRCILDPGGMKPVREGAHAKVGGTYDMFLDVEMTFTCDGGHS